MPSNIDDNYFYSRCYKVGNFFNRECLIKTNTTSYRIKAGNSSKKIFCHKILEGTKSQTSCGYSNQKNVMILPFQLTFFQYYNFFDEDYFSFVFSLHTEGPKKERNVSNKMYTITN